MAISFFNEDVNKPKLGINKIKKWIKHTAKSFNKIIGRINIIFCSDKYLLNINNEFLNHDYYTDIITFNYCEANTISGDIFISLDRVNENSQIFDSKNDELYRVIIHGILHLIGFEDHNESSKKIMRREENKALKVLHQILQDQ